jgi:hypothetical protein
VFDGSLALTAVQLEHTTAHTVCVNVAEVQIIIHLPLDSEEKAA